MQLFVIIACYRYIFPIHSTQDNLTFSQYEEYYEYFTKYK